MRAPNPNQQAAIDAIEGPLLIIAGPGSGKTFTLVERIVNLIRNHGAEPEALLVVTFTDKAARELTTRVSNRLLELGISFNLNEMYLGTFHSICLRLLKDHREFTRLQRNFALFDQFDQQYLTGGEMETIGNQKIWTFAGGTKATRQLTCGAIRKATAQDISSYMELGFVDKA